MSSKLSLSTAGLIALIITVFGFLFLSTTLAQELPDTPEPGGIPDAPYDPIAEATGQTVEDAFERELASRNIFDFHVAYLIAPDAVSSESLMSAEYFAELFGAIPIASWEEFLEQDALHPFQIVLIHESMYEDIDTAWTQHAYRNRIMIAGIGVTFEQMVDITGDYCVKQPNPHLEDQSSEMALIFSYMVTLENPFQRSVVDEHELVLCDEDFGIMAPSFTIRHGVGHIPLISKSFVEAIGAGFVTDSIEYGIIGTKPEPTSTTESTVPVEASTATGQ